MQQRPALAQGALVAFCVFFGTLPLYLIYISSLFYLTVSAFFFDARSNLCFLSRKEANPNPQTKSRRSNAN